MKNTFPPSFASQRVIQQTLTIPKEGISTVLDVAGLSKGLYLVELLDAKGQRFAAAKFTKI